MRQYARLRGSWGWFEERGRKVSGESEYKELSAAVVRLSVEDLMAAYKKVRNWHALEKKGKLREFVRREVESQEVRRREWEKKQSEKAAIAEKEGRVFKRSTFTPNYSKILLSHDEACVAGFFEENSMIQLYYGVLDIDSTPANIMERKHYIDKNKERLESSMRKYSDMAEGIGG